MSHTPEEIEEMRLIVAEADRLAREAALAEFNAHMAPLRQVTNSPAYTQVMDGLVALGEDYDEDNTVGAHVRALVQIMPRAFSAAGQLPPVDAGEE